jgi:hypothetical protein
MSTSVSLAKIRLDGGTQPRESLDQETVDEYCEAMEAKAQFPAVTVFYDDIDYWLVDGLSVWRLPKRKERRASIRSFAPVRYRKRNSTASASIRRMA